jgi:hypothetical protein
MKSKESKFKVGDRVAVYGFLRKPKSSEVYRYCRGDRGTVLHAYSYDEVRVRLDSGEESEVHPKQLRRLVKKERRRVWISESGLNDGCGYIALNEAKFAEYEDKDSFVEYVEVRRKK